MLAAGPTDGQVTSHSWDSRCSTGNTALCHQRTVSLTSVPEKAMAPHSSTFAWKIPWMEEPGRLQSMGSLESDTYSPTKPLFLIYHLACKQVVVVV